MEDKILIAEIVDGQEASYACLYNIYVKDLFSYGMGLGFEREVIKDAIQDVFLKLLSNTKILKEVTNVKFYLLRSLKNRLLDIHKNKIIYNEIDAEGPEFSIKVSVLDDLIEKEDREILEHRIQNLLSNLTNRQREAISLRYMHEMEYEEIALLLEMTPKATRKLVSRAMERLRDQNLTLIYFLLFLLVLLFCFLNSSFLKPPACQFPIPSLLLMQP